ARNCFLPRLRSSLGSLPRRPLGTASGCGTSGGGGKPPVGVGSASATAPWVGSGFDWNKSPSLVEVSQPLSHNRHASVARRCRTALAPINATPGDQALGFSPPGREHARDAPVRRQLQTGRPRLGDDG